MRTILKAGMIAVLAIYFGLSVSQGGAEPNRPDRDDHMAEGFVIKHYRPKPIDYYAETLSFESCTDSWNKLLDLRPELRPDLIVGGVEALEIQGLQCVAVDVIEKL